MKQRTPLAGIGLAVTAALVLAACDAFTSTESRLARAGQALDEGKLEAASADARAVAQKEPEHPGGWLLMARLGLKYGDGAASLKDLERATAAGASPAEVLPLQAHALLLAGQFEDVLKLPADTVALQVAHANALAAMGRLEEATQHAASALGAEPRNAEARLLAVRLQLAAGRHAEARTALAALLADEPGNSRAAAVSARLSMADGDSTAAIAQLEQAAKGAKAQLSVPEHASLLVALAETCLVAGQPDKASTTLVELRKLVPAAPAIELLSARVSLAQRDTTTAVATLQRLVAANPSLSDARLLLGATLIEQGATEQARAQLQTLIADQPGNLPARRLLARLLAAEGNAGAAERMLAELPAGVQSDATTEWMRSSLLAASGQHAEALEVLEAAAKDEPANVQLQMELVRAYLAVSRQDDARRALQTIPAQEDGWRGKQLKVLRRVIGQSGPQLRESLLAMAQENPADAELRTIVGQMLAQLGDLPGAGEQFRAALATTALPEARMGLAGVLLQQNDTASAEAQLREVIAAQPASERAYVGLAMIASRKGDTAAARKWLEQGISAIPSAAVARLALAELSYQENQGAAADALLEQFMAVTPDKPTALQRVGEVQLRAAQFTKAATSLERAHAQRPSGMLAVQLFAARRGAKLAQPQAVLQDWLKSHPDDAPARAALAEHLLNEGSHRAAIAEYERLAKQGSAPAVLNNLAWLYQTTGDGRAEATAKRAYDAAPASPQIADTYGWILLEKGRAAEALPLLTKAAEGLPDNAEVQANLQRARDEAGRK